MSTIVIVEARCIKFYKNVYHEMDKTQYGRQPGQDLPTLRSLYIA